MEYSLQYKNLITFIIVRFLKDILKNSGEIIN